MRGKRILTKYRKKELEYMCLQYQDYKKDLAIINMAVGSSEWADPTFDEVLRRENLKKKIFIIEESAKDCGDLSSYILKAVTKGLPYEAIDIPCGRRQFYDLRDEFFIILSQKEQRL